MSKKPDMPMEYRIDLGNGKMFIMQLPCPWERLNKKERTKLKKWIFQYVDAIVLRNKTEAYSTYNRLKEEWGFT